jgi:hypothetical protein
MIANYVKAGLICLCTVGISSLTSACGTWASNAVDQTSVAPPTDRAFVG